MTVIHLPPLYWLYGSPWVKVYHSCEIMCFIFSSVFPFCQASDAQSASGTRNATCSAHATSCHGNVFSMPAERRGKKVIYHHIWDIYIFSLVVTPEMLRTALESWSRARDTVRYADHVKYMGPSLAWYTQETRQMTISRGKTSSISRDEVLIRWFTNFLSC